MEERLNKGRKNPLEDPQKGKRKEKKNLEPVSLKNFQKVNILHDFGYITKQKKIDLSLCLPMFGLELKKKFLFINLLPKLLLGCLENLENVGCTEGKVKSDAR